METKELAPSEQKMFECGNLLQTQEQQLKTIEKNIEDPKITYKRLAHRIDGMLTINHIVHLMLMEIDDSNLK